MTASPETPDFGELDRRAMHGRQPGDGLTGMTLLEDGRRGADVGARCGCRPYACTALLLSQTSRFML
jgi:hypothetical protein